MKQHFLTISQRTDGNCVKSTFVLYKKCCICGTKYNNVENMMSKFRHPSSLLWFCIKKADWERNNYLPEELYSWISSSIYWWATENNITCCIFFKSTSTSTNNKAHSIWFSTRPDLARGQKSHNWFVEWNQEMTAAVRWICD